MQHMAIARPDDLGPSLTYILSWEEHWVERDDGVGPSGALQGDDDG